MALTSRWKKESDTAAEDNVPEWARDEVAEKDGYWVLDVQGMRPKGDVDDFRRRNKTLQTKLEELETSMEGGLSAEEAIELQQEIAELGRKIAEGDDGERIEKLLEERTTEVVIAGTKFTVLRHQKSTASTLDKKLTTDTSASAKTITALTDELGDERIVGGASTAIVKIGGFREKAVEEAVDHIKIRAKLGSDHQPYFEDPEADLEEQADGSKRRPAMLDGEGKILSIEGYLRKQVDGGPMEGYWTESARGPKGRMPKPGGRTPDGKPMAGKDRIAKALRARAS